MSKLKLFVWRGEMIYDGEDASGMAFAIAENENEAIRMIQKDNSHVQKFQDLPEIFELNKKVGFLEVQVFDG